MPLIQSFITYRQNMNRSMVCLASLVLFMPMTSCGVYRWHSIEQTPAKEVAYIRGGVYVSGEYVRSALIAEIDGKKIITPDNQLVEIAPGKHQITINCHETKGEFNSKEFAGKAKIITFEAQIQRTYQVRCVPFTHWWIEDLRNKSFIAGDKLN